MIKMVKHVTHVGTKDSVSTFVAWADAQKKDKLFTFQIFNN